MHDELRRQTAVAGDRIAEDRLALGDVSPPAVAGDRAGRDVLAGTADRADDLNELALQAEVVASGKASPAKRSLSDVEQEIEDAMAANKTRQAATAANKAEKAKAKAKAKEATKKGNERRGLQR